VKLNLVLYFIAEITSYICLVRIREVLEAVEVAGEEEGGGEEEENGEAAGEGEVEPAGGAEAGKAASHPSPETFYPRMGISPTTLR
jgi:hypothetical protein